MFFHLCLLLLSLTAKEGEYLMIVVILNPIASINIEPAGFILYINYATLLTGATFQLILQPMWVLCSPLRVEMLWSARLSS